MWSLSTIVEFSRLSALAAIADEKVPYQPASHDECLGWGEKLHFIPDLGDYRPAGWKLVEHETVDSSGFGAEWEPALTTRQLRLWCAERVALDKTAGFALIETGQFQAVIGYFSQDPDIEAEDVYGIDDVEIAFCNHCGQPLDASKDTETCPWPDCGADLTGDDEDFGDEYYDDDELDDE